MTYFRKIRKSFSIKLVALSFLLFLCGCGGGGGGGSGNSPVVPSTSNKASVEGYVSKTQVSGSIRADIGQNLTQPAKDALCELISFDKSGTEHTLGTTKTDSTGHYKFNSLENPYGNKNAIVRARDGANIFECVIPSLKNQTLVRAPTMDPTTKTQAEIIREAAKFGRQSEINLAELFAVIPPEAVEKIQGKASEIAKKLIAREEAKSKKFSGAGMNQLDEYSFELQQTINEKVERGEISPQDAWKLFDKTMKTKAKTLGIKAEDLQALDDINQAFIFEPFSEDLSKIPDFSDEFESMQEDRLRSRMIEMLNLVQDSVKVLVGTNPKFADFFAIADSIKKKIEISNSMEELWNLFENGNLEIRGFSEFIGLALLETKFTPDLIAEVYSIDVPEFGFVFANRTSRNSGKRNSVSSMLNQTGFNTSSGVGTPEDLALIFIQIQDSIFQVLLESVKKVASKAGLSLSPEKLKAVAYIIWATSPENLNFEPPPPPSFGPPPFTDFSISGYVSATNSVSLKGYVFNYLLTPGDGLIEPLMNSSSGMMEPQFFGYEVYLTASDSFELIDASSGITKTVSQTSLSSLAALGKYVDLEGLLVSAPSVIQPMPLGPYPVGNDPIGLKILIDGSSPSSPGRSNPGSIGIGGGVTYVPEPMYMIVQRARFLPPPPPPPEEFKEVRGQIVQSTANGQPVPGLFVFKSGDSKFDGALLKSSEFDLFQSSYIRFDQWLGKQVLLSGVLTIDPNGLLKIIYVESISAI